VGNDGVQEITPVPVFGGLVGSGIDQNLGSVEPTPSVGDIERRRTICRLDLEQSWLSLDEIRHQLSGVGFWPCIGDGMKKKLT
jgi:hypothetical protein